MVRHHLDMHKFGDLVGRRRFPLFGILIVLVGVYLLLQQMGLLVLDFTLWPVLIILLGILLIARQSWS